MGADAGLSITIPGGVGEMALVILNVPNPYATGDKNPGGNFGIQVNGTLQAAYASFTYKRTHPARGAFRPRSVSPSR